MSGAVVTISDWFTIEGQQVLVYGTISEYKGNHPTKVTFLKASKDGTPVEIPMENRGRYESALLVRAKKSRGSRNPYG